MADAREKHQEEAQRKRHETESKSIEETKEPRNRIGTPICTYFLKGSCKFGSVCTFPHQKRQHGQKPESVESFRPEKRAKTIQGLGDSRETNLGFDLEEKDIPENRRADSEQNLQEQRNDETKAQDNLQEIPENENVNTHDQQNPQEQIQRDIERQGKEAQDNLQEKRLMEMPENQSVANQQTLEEQRQKDIERQRSEARLRTDQIRRTVRFNDLSKLRDSLRELGIERKEGDGF